MRCGIVSRLAFQTAALKKTETRFASSAAITSGTERLRNVSHVSLDLPAVEPLQADGDDDRDGRARRARCAARRSRARAPALPARTSSRCAGRRAARSRGSPARAAAVWLRSPSPMPSASCSSRMAPGASARFERSTIVSTPGRAVSKTPSVQPHDAVAEAARRRARRAGCGSRAACGTGAPGGAPMRRSDGVGALQLPRDLAARGEGQDGVVVAVGRDLVALAHHPLDDLGVPLGVLAEHEERGARAVGRAARRAPAASCRATARRRR